MSLDKAEKSLGTRHKARECALQMLFAHDVVGNAGFSHLNYWGELGYEQFQKGANELIWSVVQESEKIDKNIEALRKYLKQIEVVDRQSSPFERLKILESQNLAFRTKYKQFVDTIALGEIPSDAQLLEKLESLADALRNFYEDYQFFFSRSFAKKGEDDSKDFLVPYNQIDRSLKEFLPELLPFIAKTFSSIHPYREFADKLTLGTIENLEAIDEVLRTRAEHWRIERMAIVDRNVLRLAVYEFLYQETPNTVAINEALEIARRFSSYEATQFVNGVLDAIKQDRLGEEAPADAKAKKSKASSK